MIEEKLKQEINRFLVTQFMCDEVPDDECLSEAAYIIDYVKKAGWWTPTKKVCEGCPDRFKGCVKLAEDQSLPPTLYGKESVEGFTEEAVKQDMIKAGWRRIMEVK